MSPGPITAAESRDVRTAAAVDAPAGPVVWRSGPARRLLHAGGLFARAALAAQRRRAPYDHAGDARAADRLLNRLLDLPPETVRECRLIPVPCDQPPFLDTGIDVAEGDRVTTFASGRTTLSDRLDVWVGPHFQLWARIGDGPVFRGARATNTFTADRAGRLRLGTCFPAAWADREGHLATPARDFARAAGTIWAVVVVWAPEADPRAALAAMAQSREEDSPIGAELDRIDHQVPIPLGWDYKWQLGQAEIFSEPPATDAHGGICCHTHQDVGVAERRVDVPLTPETRLRWRWRFDRLPSSLAEDSVLTHDYLSIAVEFDNGQDLTYYWSATLPPGYAYRCPLPQWKHMETHVVLRSGTELLGQWLAEDRPIREDYRRAVGPPPQRIVAVWLIGNSMFQRGTGSCRFADIELSDGQRTIRL